MMRHLKRILGYPRTQPITANDVAAAPQDPAMERKSKKATAALVGELMSVQRKSWEIREELAQHTLDLVAGKHK